MKNSLYTLFCILFINTYDYICIKEGYSNKAEDAAGVQDIPMNEADGLELDKSDEDCFLGFDFSF